ncbi:hypothetical protein KIL84_020829 [Mauremys mutica]|uniref:Uncharacterized protein n=1 Tax=Mauremys mutica TaxID=74926 RepID=A0A9D3XBC6_9SAUR|nr:hypothetical protein KIL84_020829 [Mauremys mutica]
MCVCAGEDPTIQPNLPETLLNPGGVSGLSLVSAFVCGRLKEKENHCRFPVSIFPYTLQILPPPPGGKGFPPHPPPLPPPSIYLKSTVDCWGPRQALCPLDRKETDLVVPYPGLCCKACGGKKVLQFLHPWSCQAA